MACRASWGRLRIPCPAPTRARVLRDESREDRSSQGSLLPAWLVPAVGLGPANVDHEAVAHRCAALGAVVAASVSRELKPGSHRQISEQGFLFGDLFGTPEVVAIQVDKELRHLTRRHIAKRAGCADRWVRRSAVRRSVPGRVDGDNCSTPT